MTNDPQWSPCESGTLDNLTNDSRVDSVQWTRRGALAAMVTVAAGGGLFLLRSAASDEISCAHVAKLGPDYIADIVAAEQGRRIDAHRQKCAQCDSMLTQLEKQRDQQA